MSQQLIRNLIWKEPGFEVENLTCELESETYYQIKKEVRNNKSLWIESDETIALIRTVIETFLPAGFEINEYSIFGHKIAFDFNVELSWGVGARMKIQLGDYVTENFSLVNENEEQKERTMRIHHGLKAEITWSSTGRDMETAQASIDLYQEMVTFGRKIETLFRGYNFIDKAEYQYLKELEVVSAPQS